MNTRETLISKDGILEISGLSAKSLIKKFGSPLYVMDVSYIEKMCETFTSSLEEYYGYGQIFYASKAFCCKEIYRIINNYDMGADSVSIGEMYTAKKAKFSMSKIILHGNNKLYDEIDFAVKNKVRYIVIDALSDIDLIDEIALEYNRVQDVLIRVNPGVEAHTHKFIQTATPDSKFGFSIENGDAKKVISRVLKKNNIKLRGLHCHIGSQIFESQSFRIATNKMLSFYKQIKDEFNYDFDVLDMGGGFGIYYNDEDPKTQLNDYRSFIKVICDSVLENIKNYNIKKPFLILEPGRSLVGEAGITLYTVGAIKEIKGIKKYLSIDGGMFENPRFALYQAKYTACAPEKMNDACNETYCIAGKCCESGDVLIENCRLPKMNTGDILAVFSTGAYNYSMASNYNRNFIPAVIAVKNKKAKLIIKRQTLKDIIKNDI